MLDVNMLCPEMEDRIIDQSYEILVVAFQGDVNA